MRLSRPPKPPLFTRKFFATESFGPGHVVGAGVLAVGLYAVVKAFATRSQGLTQPTQPSGITALAQTANVRGQYGIPFGRRAS